jgi:hypothetical protein
MSISYTTGHHQELCENLFLRAGNNKKFSLAKNNFLQPQNLSGKFFTFGSLYFNSQVIQVKLEILSIFIVQHTG